LAIYSPIAYFSLINKHFKLSDFATLYVFILKIRNLLYSSKEGIVHALKNKKYLILYLNISLIGFKMWNIQTHPFFSLCPIQKPFGSECNMATPTQLVWPTLDFNLC